MSGRSCLQGTWGNLGSFRLQAGRGLVADVLSVLIVVLETSTSYLMVHIFRSDVLKL